MKNKIQFLLLTSFAFALAFTSCSLTQEENSEPGTTAQTAILNLSSIDSEITLPLSSNFSIRTIRPTDSSLVIAKYHLAGVGPDSITHEEDFTDEGIVITTQPVAVGPWTFTITALNSTGVVLLTGSTSVTVSAVSQVSSNVALSRASGNGTASISVTIDSGVTLAENSPSSITIETLDSSGAVAATTTSAFTKTENVYTYTGTFAAGAYNFKADFIDTSNNNISLFEVVQVFANIASSQSYTYTSEDFTATNTSVKGVYLNLNKLYLLPDGTRTLSYTINPSNATNTNVTWSSSDESVATVSSAGLVTAVKEGTTTITVTTEDGGKKHNCVIIVSDSWFDSENAGSFIGVTGGTFNNGSSDVTVSNFSIGKYEVTQAVYQLVMGSNPSYFTSSPATNEIQENRPVEQVSWYDCLVFCNTLSILESLTPCYSISDSTNPTDWGSVPTSDDSTWNSVICDFTANGYRLPTEAEWQFAAMGGNSSNGYSYSGSNTINDVSWYSSNCDSKTHEVGLKKANELGLYDMSGNVWEWCWDRYGNYATTAQTDPTGATSGSSRVDRGGSYAESEGYDGISYRHEDSSQYSASNHGLRLVRRP